MKNTSLYTVLLALALMSSVFEAKEIKKKIGFDTPSKLYDAHINGQTITFNYSSCVSSKATRVQFVLFVIVGDSSSGKQFGWVQTSNAIDFHYSAVWGNHQNTYWSWYSDTFQLKTTPDRTATLSANVKIGGLNNGMTLYCAGYWENVQDQIQIQTSKNSLRKSDQ